MNEEDKKFKHLAITLSFGIGISLTGLVASYLPPQKIVLKVNRIPSSWKPAIVSPIPQKRLSGLVLEQQIMIQQNLFKSIDFDRQLIRLFPLQIQIEGVAIRLIPVNGMLNQIFFDVQHYNVNTPIIGHKLSLTPGIQLIELNQIPVTFINRHRSSRLQLYQLTFTNIQNERQEWKLITDYNQQTNEVRIVNAHSNARLLTTSRGRFLYRHMKVMNATAYYPGPECIGKNFTGLTFTGKKATYGIVAVDPRVIPLGSSLYIEGYGHAEAADTGGAIRGNRIDLCFDTYQEAVIYGRKKVKVYLLE